jgi:hypothetical protein
MPPIVTVRGGNGFLAQPARMATKNMATDAPTHFQTAVLDIISILLY